MPRWLFRSVRVLVFAYLRKCFGPWLWPTTTVGDSLDDFICGLSTCSPVPILKFQQKLFADNKTSTKRKSQRRHTTVPFTRTRWKSNKWVGGRGHFPPAPVVNVNVITAKSRGQVESVTDSWGDFLANVPSIVGSNSIRWHSIRRPAKRPIWGHLARQPN